MKQTIEQQAADTILEAPLGTIELDGREYQIKPPTTATLIMVSGLISQLPEMQLTENNDSVLFEVLTKAKDCGAILGQIAATIILGEKRIREQPLTTIYHREHTKAWDWKRLRRVTKTSAITVFERDHLAQELISNLTPGELGKIILAALSTESVSDFFVLTTSLHTKNTLKATRTEVDEATASGLLS